MSEVAAGIPTIGPRAIDRVRVVIGGEMCELVIDSIQCDGWTQCRDGSLAEAPVGNVKLGVRFARIGDGEQMA